MNEVKLIDFTDEELRVAYIAIGLEHAKETDPKKKDILERWLTQLIHAAGVVAFKEQIANN